MSLLTTHSDTNLVIDEALSVHYSNAIIQGSWSWFNGLNAGGTYDTMRELHRYARKTFRYVGMSYAAAKNCAAAMRSLFTRSIKTSYWNNGSWNVDTAGTMLMADVTCVHTDGDCWDVHVSVNEDDVRYFKVQDTLDLQTLFNTEITGREYGSDGHGTAAEKEVYPTT